MDGNVNSTSIISGELSSVPSISGSLSPPASVSGELSIPTYVDVDIYEGEYEITPDFEEQTLQTKNKTLMRNITVNPIRPATITALGGIIVGDDLQITQSGVLSVTKANAVEQDNTHPITSAAVYTEIGNIDALLQTI